MPAGSVVCAGGDLAPASVMVAGPRCPRCHRVDLIRMERVITGQEFLRSYHCGSCHHTWEVADNPRKRPRADATPKRRPR